MSLDLIKAVNTLDKNVDYVPYNMANVVLTAGVPPIPLKGIESVSAAALTPRVSLVMSMNTKGVFVSNQNLSGIIEITLLKECASSGYLQVLNLAGIPFPIYGTDKDTAGTSFILASECRQVNTPAWRKSGGHGVVVYTYHTPRLIVSQGVRKAE